MEVLTDQKTRCLIDLYVTTWICYKDVHDFTKVLKYCADDYESMVTAGNKDLIFKDTDKWDVHKLKDLLFRLNHTQCRTLYERRHNIGHVYGRKGLIETFLQTTNT